MTTSRDHARAKEERMRPPGAASSRSRWFLLVGLIAVVVGVAGVPRASASPSTTASGT